MNLLTAEDAGEGLLGRNTWRLMCNGKCGAVRAEQLAPVVILWLSSRRDMGTDDILFPMPSRW